MSPCYDWDYTNEEHQQMLLLLLQYHPLSRRSLANNLAKCCLLSLRNNQEFRLAPGIEVEAHLGMEKSFLSWGRLVKKRFCLA